MTSHLLVLQRKCNALTARKWSALLGLQIVSTPVLSYVKARWVMAVAVVVAVVMAVATASHLLVLQRECNALTARKWSALLGLQIVSTPVLSYVKARWVMVVAVVMAVATASRLLVLQRKYNALTARKWSALLGLQIVSTPVLSYVKA